ncbi:hypothetical protein [Helicobacter canis]|uniref:NfeD family protein n=1 Tax=Helicobacter canis TaxID=29419 RepID=A0A5M9QR64_9HELI|nr:hypothetical protein [Helicobacter canis]KAA8710487.1 hypothetical protein F4V45_02965 [Helicobacter canis]
MSALMLLGLGLGFIVAEIFFGSFFLFFIGLGLCITAGIEYIIGFGGGSVESVYAWQAVSICAFAFLTLISLRKPIKSWFKGSQVYEDSLQNGGGVGEIQQEMVYFKGTLWAYELEKSPESSEMDSKSALDSMALRDGDKVEILSIEKGRAIIKLA